MANVGGMAEGAVFVAPVTDFDEALHAGRILRRVVSYKRRLIALGEQIYAVMSVRCEADMAVVQVKRILRDEVLGILDTHLLSLSVRSNFAP